MKWPYRLIKRVFDLVLALLMTPPALLLLAVCFCAIKLETNGPTFFVQTRPGYKGKLFRIYKLRTLIVETERGGLLLSDMERMTRSGIWIRKLSLDELPQILNILKGEMSFIGPRPLLVEYLPRYTQEQMRRHDVLPGISGWAQVNGRNEISWSQKFARDCWYVDHLCFVLDVRIFVLTVMNVLRRQGINAGANETMKPFAGKEAY